jgi:hypothetical protein
MNECISSAHRRENEDTQQATTTRIYDVEKYKHDYFLTDLSYVTCRKSPKFGAPTGICTLSDDRLLVANRDLEIESVLLLDTNGVVYQTYPNILEPKAIHYDDSIPSTMIVAVRKGLTLIDITTGQVVAKSKCRGFYPWHVQYIKQAGVYAGVCILIYFCPT